MWSFARPWFKPHGLRISWRGAVLTVARWPVVLWALVSVVMRIKRPYMITPKGVSPERSRKAIVAHGPLLACGTVALAGVWLSGALQYTGDGGAYVLLVLINALITILATGIVVLLEMGGTPATDGSLSATVLTPTAAFAWLMTLVGALATTTVVFWDSVRAGLS
jgi:cellulose synthase (UDP-forming)